MFEEINDAADTRGLAGIIAYIGKNDELFTLCAESVRSEVLSLLKEHAGRLGLKGGELAQAFRSSGVKVPEWLSNSKARVDERLLAEDWIRGVLLNG